MEEDVDRDRRDGAEGEQLGAEGREVGRVVEGEVVCFAVPVKKHTGFAPILDDATGVDVSEAGTFFQGGDGGCPDGTFGSGGVFEVVRGFEVDDADFCDRDLGHFRGRMGFTVRFPVVLMEGYVKTQWERVVRGQRSFEPRYAPTASVSGSKDA